MLGSLLVLDLVFRGVAVGCLVATGVALVRGPAGRDARISGGLFALSITAYAINSSDALRALCSPFMAPIWLLSVGGAGFVWLFLNVLFADRRLTPPLLAPVALLIAVGGIGIWSPRPAANGVWILHNLIEAGLAIHALTFVVRSWRDDLVEDRRRLRGPFLAAVIVYVLVLSGFEIGESLGVAAPWYEVAGAVSLGLFCLVGTATFLAPRDSLFGPARAAAPAVVVEGSDPQDRAIAQRLDTLMGGEEIWRREGLTIGALAQALAAPEHRVRRVINTVLGHRNFAAFVNARRVAAAKAALADPANAGRTVAALAFDLGFGSLGPFNRAFKDETGQTPTEFRLTALAENPKP